MRKPLFFVALSLLLVACSSSERQEVEAGCAALLGRLVGSAELKMLDSSKLVASQKTDKSQGKYIFIYYSPDNNASLRRNVSPAYDLLCVADTIDRKPMLIADASYHLRIMRLGLVDPLSALHGLVITGIVNKETASQVQSYVRSNKNSLATTILRSSYLPRLEMIDSAFKALNIKPIP